MKLIIDIPNHVKNRLIFGATYKDDLRIMVEALTNGTPLPKGHGRIIDESKIEVCEWVDLWEEDYPKASTDAPTIIEADGGGEDEVSD